jgi:hypothetical protein
MKENRAYFKKLLHAVLAVPFTFGLPLCGALPTVAVIAPATGSTAGGTSVTITGTDFTGATAVTIGGVAAASFTVDSATQITATTPAGTAGTASVLVTTPGGTNAGNTLYTYVTTIISATTGNWRAGAADTAPGNLSLQLRENDLAPGTGGLVFSDFIDLVLGGGDYEFLVIAELRGPGVVVNTNDKGLWAKHATNGLVLLAREGSEAPGVPGSSFFRITQIALPGAAQPMFQASMRTGTGGVTTANDTGLWVINKANEVKLAVREGDVLNVGGTNRTVTAITPMLNGTTTGGARFLADGQLTVLLTFSGGVQAHAKVVVP